MKKYPYFMSDAVLLFLAAVSIIIPVASPQLLNFGFAFFTVFLFAAFFTTYNNQEKDFEKYITRIKGLTGWDTKFFSIGTVYLYYRGEQATYHSSVQAPDKNIPVDYYLEFENDNPAEFIISKNSSGGFSVQGDDSVLGVGKKEISHFDECYSIRSISNEDGTLQLCVRLEFERSVVPTKKDEKLTDMSGFLEDFLSFAYMLNLVLKTKKSKASNKN